MTENAQQEIRFGDVALQRDARRLRRGGTEIHVSTKAFDLLIMLLDARPAVLPKQTLIERLWQDVFVQEVNLANLVAEVRRALGDDGRHQKYIRTHHGIGYAWIGEAAIRDPALPDVPPACVLMRNGVTLVLGIGEHVLGRGSHTSVIFDAATVSRRHVRLVITECSVTVEDLGSRNGTFVNGKSVTTSIHVDDGDEIALGDVTVTLRRADKNLPTIPVSAETSNVAPESLRIP